MTPSTREVITVDRAGRTVHCSAIAMTSPRRCPTLGHVLGASEMAGYVPAAFVTQKVKSVCDGILAAIEGLSTEGDELGMGVRSLLSAISQHLAAGQDARELVEAALDLGRGTSRPGGRAQRFLDDNPERAKVLGFYTWSDALQQVFRRDRFLQQRLYSSEAEELARAIAADAQLTAEYTRHLRRVARLTNPFACGTLERRIRGELPPSDSVDEALFPASDTVENQYPSVAEFLSAVQRGACDLKPTAASGFYAHQLYALTALLRPDATLEARHRTIDSEYAAALELFAAASLFFARESHVKQLELAPGMAAAVVEPVRWIPPGLTIEPLPTFYALTADAFRFLRTVIEGGWGSKAFDAAQLRESGPIASTIGAGIDDVVSLCSAAADLSRRELDGAASGPDVDAWRARLRALFEDPDATGDARGMVPMGLTKSGQVRALVFAGWEVHTLSVRLTHLAELPPGARLGAESHPLPIPMVRETVLPTTGLLNRAEVRAVCDGVLYDPNQAPVLLTRLGEARAPVV